MLRSLGLAECSHSSLLPFLYQTRTIATAYSDRSPLNLEQKAGQGAEEERSLQDIKNKWSSIAARRPSRRTEDDTFGRTRSASTTSYRMQNVRGRPKQLHSVPFEGETGSATPAERLQNTTMTPREMQVFETLFRKGIERKKTERQQKAGKRAPPPRTASVIQFPELLRPLAEEAELMRLQITLSDVTNDKTTKNTNLISSLEIKDSQAIVIKSLMDSATSDIELYQILHNQIFLRISSTPSSEALQTNFPALPALLQHYINLQTTKLPTTHSLGLLVLAELKKISPLAFALGATTELYNSHMHLLWRQYRDMENIAATLEEMDKEVYSFNQGTQELLGQILAHARDASNGKFGDAVQTLWSMDRKRRGIEIMRRWRREVDERLRAKAVSEAKDADVEVDGEENNKLEEVQHGGSRGAAVA